MEERKVIASLTDELALARQEIATLRAAINAVMPRYVELFTLTGLGKPEDSVAVQMAARAMGLATEAVDDEA